MLNEITEIKLKLLCSGIRLPENILNSYPGYRYKRASLSEGLCFDLFPDGCRFPVPVNLAIHEKFVKDSPFEYDDKKGMILEKGREFVRASIVDYPPWYSEQLDDGTLFQEVFQIHYHNILATSLTNFCEYKESGRGCKFCAMGYQITERNIKSAEHIKQVLAKLLEMGYSFTEVNLNSGTLLEENRNVDQYLRAVEAVRQVSDIPVYAQICPPEDFAFIDNLIDAGVNSLSFNMEIYDEKLRKEVMPVKGRIPRDKYFEALAYAVFRMGAHEVSSWLIAGLEPAESSIEGIKRIAATGAVPFVTVFRPLIGSEFEDRHPPSYESVAPVFSSLGEELLKMNYDHAKTSAGCVKCNCCSAITEVMT